MIETRVDQIFRSGFEHARQAFDSGLSLSQVLRELTGTATNSHMIDGAKAFVDLRTGCVGTSLAARAGQIGLSL